MTNRERIRMVVLVLFIALFGYLDNLITQINQIILVFIAYAAIWMGLNHKIIKKEWMVTLASALISTFALAATLNQFSSRMGYNFILFTLITGFGAYVYSKRSRSAAFLIMSLGMTHAGSTELYLSLSPYSLIFLWMALEEVYHSRTMCIPRRAQSAVVFMGIFAFISIVSAVCAVSSYNALQMTLYFCVYTVYFICLLISFHSEKDLKYLIGYLMILGGTYMGFALYDFSVRAIYMGIKNSISFRVFVIGRHPNYVIFPTMLLVPLWIYKSLDAFNKRSRYLFAGLGGISIFYLLTFSYSRESWLVLGIYAIFTVSMFYREKHKKQIVISGLTIFVIIVTLVFSIPTLNDRVQSIFRIASNQRIEAWHTFLNALFDRPILGFGFGALRYIYPSALNDVYPMTPPTRQFMVEAHNLYVDVLMATGLAGLLIFIIFLYKSILISLGRSRRRDLVWSLISLGIIMDFFFNFRLHAFDTAFVLIAWLSVLTIKRCHPLDTIAWSHSRVIYVILSIIIILNFRPWLADRFIAKAQNQLARKNWSTMKTFYGLSQFIEPLNPHIHYYLALCDEQLRNPNAMLHHYQKAVQLSPNYHFYRYHLATAYMRVDQKNEAIGEIGHAINLLPDGENGKYYLLSGFLKHSNGDNEGAEDDLVEAVLWNPYLITHNYWEKDPLLRKKIVKKCISASHLLINNFEKAPWIKKYVFNMSTLMDLLEQKEWSEEIMRRFYMFNPFDVEISIRYAALLIKHQQLDRAQSVIESFENSKDTAVRYLLEGYIAYLQNDHDQAVFLLEKSVEKWRHLSLDNIKTYELLAELYRLTGEHKKLYQVEKKLLYLNAGEYEMQKKDLTIHRGKGRLELDVFDLL